MLSSSSEKQTSQHLNLVDCNAVDSQCLQTNTDQTIYQHLLKVNTCVCHIEACAALLLCSDLQDWFIILLSTSR